MRRPAPLLLAALVPVILAACGGGATPTPAGSSATTPSSPAASVPPSAGAVGSAAPSAAPSTAGAACAVAPAGAATDVTVAIKDFAYAPEPVAASVGDVITWTNEDSAPHSATLEDDSCGTPTLARGSSGSLVFGAAGTYTYKCIVHPGQMKGFTIEVK